MDQMDPFVTKAIDRHRATYNHLVQGSDFVQKVEGDEGDEGLSSLADRFTYLLPGDVVGIWYVSSGMVAIMEC